MKNKFVLSLILGLLITLGPALVSESAVDDISSDIIRLHIVANSNEAGDQKLKLSVRDRILKEVNSNSLNELHLKEIESICTDEIKKSGYDYNVKVVCGKYYFPTKSYENITLPAGEYNAVRVLIGDAVGDNWWCVMYPPLCFRGSIKGSLDKNEINNLKSSMKEDNFHMIESDEIKFKASFKIVELWQKLKHRN